ncbi:RibD family protein [Hamadaea tsunoensis]|uniref:RibD family protein n=1 Tax=Hamadaea tsunoensis TaxID=53368 RepID=UPI0004147308|nr:dihydrofolate reductase family protein [Hamadaea tsunoensis]
MHVILSCAMSVDGYIDDGAPERLLLSNGEDFDRVDEVRAGVDAILVGATTIRRDDPRLLVRSADRRAARVARGEPESPVKVTLTRLGDLDPAAAFFTTGTGEKLVYCADEALDKAAGHLGGVATVVPAAGIAEVFADLAARGVRRLMVEGGTSVHTQVLAAGLADELHLVVAPFFVGDGQAPRFVNPGPFPFTSTRPMRLAEARPIGDCVLLRYEL